MYYQKSDAIIFVYDITNLNSFNELKKSYNTVKHNVDISKIIVYLVGNKNDLYASEQVKKEDAQKYAKSIKATYRCVSALNSSGIDELFESVANSVYVKKNGEIKTKDPEDIYIKELKIQPELKVKRKRRGGCC